MSKLFQKLKEDFVCDVCGYFVKGNGYTNHCPFCLSSKHVDVYPGDRASDCHGIMYAVNLEVKGSDYILTQKCEKCGHIRKNKAAANDSQKALRALSSGQIKEYIEKMKKKPTD